MALNFSQGGVTVSPKMKPGIHKVYIHDVSFGVRKEGDVKHYLTLELRNEINQHHLVNFSCSSTSESYQESMLYELQYLLQSFMNAEQLVKLLTSKEVGKLYDEKNYNVMWEVLSKEIQTVLAGLQPQEKLFVVKLQGMVNEFNGKTTEFAGWDFPRFKDNRTKSFIVKDPFIASVANANTLSYEPSKDMTLERFLAMKASAAPAPRTNSNNAIDDLPNPFAY